VSKKDRPTAQTLLKHPFILKYTQDVQTLTIQDKKQFLNSMIKYQYKPEFFKMMCSMAIGLDMDQDNKEQRKKI
jgi:hypothetical protein